MCGNTGLQGLCAASAAEARYQLVIRMMMFTETSLQFEMEDRWEAELGYFGDEEGSRVVQNPWIATSYMCQQICASRTLISFYVVEVVALRTTV